MDTFTVTIDWTASTSNFDPHALDEHGAALGVRGRDLSATLTVEAAGMAAALEAAQTYCLSKIPGDVVAAEVLTIAEHDRRLAQPAFPELAGIAEVAELLEVSRQRASQLQTREGFPAPVAVLRSGPVWRKGDLATFAATWERRPGRIPKASS